MTGFEYQDILLNCDWMLSQPWLGPDPPFTVGHWGEGLQLVEHAAGHGPAPTAPGLVRIENLPLPRRWKVCGWRLVRSTIGNFWAQSECLGYNDLVSSFIEIWFSCIDSNNHSPRLSCFNHWCVQSLNSPAKASPVISMSTGGLLLAAVTLHTTNSN